MPKSILTAEERSEANQARQKFMQDIAEGNAKLPEHDFEKMMDHSPPPTPGQLERAAGKKTEGSETGPVGMKGKQIDQGGRKGREGAPSEDDKGDDSESAPSGDLRAEMKGSEEAATETVLEVDDKGPVVEETNSTAVDPNIAIPDDWKSLPWQDKRALARNFSKVQVTNMEQANTIIAAEVKRREG